MGRRERWWRNSDHQLDRPPGQRDALFVHEVLPSVHGEDEDGAVLLCDGDAAAVVEDRHPGGAPWGAGVKGRCGGGFFWGTEVGVGAGWGHDGWYGGTGETCSSCPEKPDGRQGGG